MIWALVVFGWALLGAYVMVLTDPPRNPVLCFFAFVGLTGPIGLFFFILMWAWYLIHGGY